MTDSPTAHDRLPLPHQDLHLLLAIGEAPLHGYAMMKAVEEQSKGVLRVELGSLYRIIHRLERDGLIERAADADGAPTPGRERRFYRITDLGRAVVAAELDRLRAVLELAGRGGFRPSEA